MMYSKIVNIEYQRVGIPLIFFHLSCIILISSITELLLRTENPTRNTLLISLKLTSERRYYMIPPLHSIYQYDEKKGEINSERL